MVIKSEIGFITDKIKDMCVCSCEFSLCLLTEGVMPDYPVSHNQAELVGGTDPIACETVCCRLIGINPEQIPIIKRARQMGVGCSDPAKIKIVGDDFSSNICLN